MWWSKLRSRVLGWVHRDCLTRADVKDHVTRAEMEAHVKAAGEAASKDKAGEYAEIERFLRDRLWRSGDLERAMKMIDPARAPERERSVDGFLERFPDAGRIRVT